jgi:uncharacterized membrane protein
MISRWFRAIARTRESQPHDPRTVLLFASFVGIMRLMTEVFFLGFNTSRVAEQLVLYVSWYWMCFYVFAAVLKLCIPADWRYTINVVLVGLFLGFFPPVIDTLASGWNGEVMGRDGFSYQYIREFPQEWPLLLIKPDGGIPFGEAAVLWAIIIFMGGYILVRTASWWRALAGAFGAYMGCVLIAGVVPTVVNRYFTDVGYPPLLVLTVLQALVATIIYFAIFRSAILSRLAARSVHLLPLLGVCSIGWAWHAELDALLCIALTVVFMLGVFALIQNEYRDRETDLATRGETDIEYADEFLLAVLSLTTGAAMIAWGFIEGAVVLVFVVVSYLYNAPPYRGKRFFPSAYKLEGAWGGAAFALGAIPAIRTAMNELVTTSSPTGSSSAFSVIYGSFYDASGAIALLLLIGGWSVVAATKDRKDVEADQEAKHTTIYTLLMRRGWSEESAHTAVVSATTICLLFGAGLVYATTDFDTFHLAALIVLIVAMFTKLTGGLRTDSDYRVFLVALTLYLFVISFGFQSIPGLAQ